jgi:uncharacterized Zn finger protein
MKIPLTHFEEVIPTKILERGLAYYEDGAVEPPEPIDDHTFTADVIGTEVYTITYRLGGEVMTDFSCTCPYDGGPVCKHVAALLFYLRAEELFGDEEMPVMGRKRSKKTSETSGAAPKKRGRPRATADESLAADSSDDGQPSAAKRRTGKRSAKPSTPAAVLEQLSHEQLKAFMLEDVLKDKALKAKFMLRFADDAGTASIKSYVTQVRGLLRGIPMRSGYDAWQAGPKIWKAIQPMLETVNARVAQGKDHQAMLMCFALLEVFDDLLDSVDDSNGDIGDVIQLAVRQLYGLSSREWSEESRKEFLAICLGYHRNNQFQGWDWHHDMLGLSVALCRTPEEARQVMDILDKQGKKEGFTGVEAVRLRYELTGHLEGEESAETFLMAHLDVPEMREIAITRAFKRADYEMARKLVMEGMAASKKDKYRFLVSTWQDWLLRIALKEEDSATIRELARIRLLNGGRTMELLDMLQRHTEPADWPGQVESIIAEIPQKGRYFNGSLYLDILLFTNDEERLMAFLLDPRMRNALATETFHDLAVRLYGRWPDKVLRAYEELILSEFEHSRTTNAYKRNAQLLRKMKKLGNLDRVAELTGELRKRYARRPALLAVLDSM